AGPRTPSSAIRFFDLELKERMARRQSHIITRLRIPPRNDQPPRIGVRLDLPDEPRDLIDAVHLRIIAAERPPKITVNRPQIAPVPPKSRRLLRGRPLYPNIDTARPQVSLIRRPAQEPEKLLRHPAKRHTLCRHDRKTLS